MRQSAKTNTHLDIQPHDVDSEGEKSTPICGLGMGPRSGRKRQHEGGIGAQSLTRRVL